MHFLERFYPELEESLTDVHRCSLHMLSALSPSSEGIRDAPAIELYTYGSNWPPRAWHSTANFFQYSAKHV